MLRARNVQGPALRRGFSLPELVVVLGIIAILIALLLPAVQKVREAAARTRCSNNMRQLGVAFHHFNEANGALPPYWDSYPKSDSLSVKGSWFNHLLPHVEQQPLFNQLMSNIRQTGSNWDGYDVTTTESYQEWIQDTPAHWNGPPDTWVQDTAGYWNGPPDTWVEDTPAHVEWQLGGYNGHTHWEQVSVPATGHWQSNGGTYVQPTGHVQKNGGTYVQATGHYENRTRQVTRHIDNRGGIFMPGASDVTFALLRCPSDPSIGSYPDAGSGKVYTTRDSGSWGSSNYMANWHAFANDDPNSGYKTPYQRFAAITDGLSSTILLGEGYSWCDGKGRLALNTWDYHSFGLTWGLNNAWVDIGNGDQQVNFPNGMPNTIMFQVRPKPLAVADCPVGTNCCNNWASQTGHSEMNVLLADGSVRALGSGISQQTWERLLKPRDGQAVGADW